MDQLLTDDVWGQVAKICEGKGRKLGALAYVSQETPIPFGRGDILVCDASAGAIRAGQTDAAALRHYYNSGTSIYSCEGLHAKLLVWGRIAVIGSANLSESSATRLIEAALITDRVQIRSQAAAFVHNLTQISKRLDEDMLRQIEETPVLSRPRPASTSRGKLPPLGNRYWVVAVSLLKRYPANEEDYVQQAMAEVEEEAEDPNSEIAWLRFTGNSRFRSLAKAGDIVVAILRHNRGILVLQPRPILKRQDVAHWTRFYIEMPPDCLEVNWRRFAARLRSAELVSVRKSSVRELSTREWQKMEIVWQALASDSLEPQ